MNGKVRQKIVERFSDLEELFKKDPDVLEKLRQEVKRLSKNSSSDVLFFDSDLSQLSEGKGSLIFRCFS